MAMDTHCASADQAHMKLETYPSTAMSPVVAALPSDTYAPHRLESPARPLSQAARMTDTTSHTRWPHLLLFLLIGIFAFGIRYYYVVHTQVFQPVNQSHVRGDAVEYYHYAQNLVRHGVFSKAPEGAAPPASDSYRDPGYPIFLAGWMKIVKSYDGWYAAVLLSQAILGALTVVLLLYLARRWMSLPWLAGAGVLMAIWPHSVAMCSYLLTETLFGFFCALGLCFFSVSMSRRSTPWAVASGIGFALGALTNAVLLPFAPLLGLYALIRRQMNAAMFAGLILGALALTAPWVLRNSMLPQGASSSAGRAMTNLVQGSWPSYHHAYQASVQGNPDALTTMRHIDQETAALEANLPTGLALVLHRMGSEPMKYLLWYMSKPRLLWGWNIRIGQGDIYVYPTRNSPFQVDPVYRAVASACQALNPWLFVAAIIGCLLALLPSQHAPPEASATALMLVFITTVYSALQAEPRYSIPFRGPEILLGLFAIQRGVESIKRLKTHAGAEPRDS